MSGPYNTQIIVNVFRSIAHLVSLHPELLKTQGVFRVAGAKEDTEKLLEQLISEYFDVNILIHYVMEDNKVYSEHLHNILGMIPAVFKNSPILDSKDSLLINFSKKLKLLLNSQQEKDITNAANQLFDKFIHELLLSKRVDHQRAGEIIYHYCYLMHQAGIFQDTNLMTYHNLAIIMAPRLTQDLGLFPASDLLGLSGFLSQLTSVLENYITDENWNKDFKERHADKLEHLSKTSHSIREQLEHMRESSRAVVLVSMKNLTMQASKLKDEIDTIEKQLQDDPKRKVKKALTKQLRRLKEEQNELNLKVSELSQKIPTLNRGYQKIQEEIDLVSLSESEEKPAKNNRGKQERCISLAQFSIFESERSPSTPTSLSPLPEAVEIFAVQEGADYDDPQEHCLGGPQ
ncbi:RhoGAP domain protein (GTPase activator of small GTPases) [Legionella steigerwaltii]|uniref:RhoGAP domain protein (GTPase activator of small GTPases) n=1 Tax=Legionella steigerwaltii TaxID=460 RepID=A0A378L6K6_9GAMM|nr:RhoGAP domain-containing protein [Legionella steigerwaltii]KTD77004.1 RhoGAP domain protein (GTPase activator of small GTPases) [Legionella steigerwaltii]STY22433.1 RhoGAP domain protein (GTPase activator of small GTPases) [Legionella steigerwaltii]